MTDRPDDTEKSFDVIVFATGFDAMTGAVLKIDPRVFMPYLTFPDYAARCEAVVDRGYEGFDLN
ncbi:MAG: hypothetical protein JRH10_02495 [Deltaproteobacteria bacterium]|nr:hypothetical protein [Deltaproteobacteria bacterium]MBW2444728.1 hypothetical protein [Deltaproteobacteria bacterium]